VQRIDDPLIDLTFYPVADDRPRGTVIVCPGGGYHVLAAHEAEPIARWLNAAGLSAFVLRYRVAPHRHPAPLDDATRAVRLVRARAEELNVRPNRIGLLGFSAGGHLVTTLATHYDPGDPRAADPVERVSCRPDAVVACYPVVSLRTFKHEGCIGNLLGERPSQQMLDELSNELHVTGDTPPMFLWHTANDEVVPVGQSLLLAQALSDHGVPFEMHVFPHGPHGLGLSDGSSFVGASTQVAQWTSLCEAWLASLEF
jgi:acetyl esterase/lipase